MTATPAWIALVALLMVGVVLAAMAFIVAQLRAAMRRRQAENPEPPKAGFSVIAQPAEPLPVQPLGNDGPGRYRITGVIAATGVDTKMHVQAETLANAKVKAELKGVVVTDIEKE